MVEYTLNFDSVFGSLADPTRRDILQRLGAGELSVNEIAGPYKLSLAAISKHLKILEAARLVIKRRQGRQHYIALDPATIKSAQDYLQQYAALMSDRFDQLEVYLKHGEIA